MIDISKASIKDLKLCIRTCKKKKMWDLNSKETDTVLLVWHIKTGYKVMMQKIRQQIGKKKHCSS
jgi:hypothetical protein